LKLKPIYLVALSIISCTAATGVACAQGSAKAMPDTREKFEPKRDASKDIQNAIKKATKENKRILLDVGGEWCIWCKRLDEFFETNSDARQYLKEKYVVVKVNFSQENENKEVLSKYPKIPGYPHLFVLDKGGKLLHSQDTGLLETGDHHDHDKVMTFLKKWAG